MEAKAVSQLEANPWHRVSSGPTERDKPVTEVQEDAGTQKMNTGKT